MELIKPLIWYAAQPELIETPVKDGELQTTQILYSAGFYFEDETGGLNGPYKHERHAQSGLSQYRDVFEGKN
jgi:hypothetical protein